MEKSKIIEVKNLTKFFDSIEVVKNVSFDIYEGEFFALIGKNGAGKSTIINMITTMLNIDDGSVIINGVNIQLNSFKVREQIGVVFQNFTLDAKMSVYENLRLHSKIYNLNKDESDKRISDLLKLVKLEDKRNYKVKHLSGGQKRMIELIRSILHKPKVLFMDEPTTGLDPQARIEIWDYILKIKKQENMTIVLTSHYMEEVNECDRIIVISDGVIVDQGSPEQLKQKLSNNKIVFSAKNVKKIESSLKKINVKMKVTILKNNFEIQLPSNYTPADFILNLLRISKEELDDLNIIKPTMDDVFISSSIDEEMREKDISTISKRLINHRELKKHNRRDLKIERAKVATKEKFNVRKLNFSLLYLRDIKKTFKSPIELIAVMVFPFLLWLMMSTMSLNIFDNFAESMIANIAVAISATTLTVGLFYGVGFFEDIESGFMKEVLVSPLKRWEIYFSKMFSGITTLIIPAFAITIVGFGINSLVPEESQYEFVNILSLISANIIVSMLWISFSILIALKISSVKSMQSLITIFLLVSIFLNGTTIQLPDEIVWIVLLNPTTYTSMVLKSALQGFDSQPLVIYDITIDFWVGWVVTTVSLITLTILSIDKLNKIEGNREIRHSKYSLRRWLNNEK